MTWVLAAVCALASVPAAYRWIRVAQREHYLAPAATRFAARWWASRPLNAAMLALAAVAAVATVWNPWPGFVVALAQLGPVGLTVRGRTSPLRWTARSRRLALACASLLVVIFLTGSLGRAPVVVVAGLLLLPLLVDLALWTLAPVEARLGRKWVDRAAQRLAAVGAEVVAITGSYGKTTTKGYVAHLLSGSRRVVASPASFNNRMGLARAINESLVSGTEVFVAEMGTYGKGEIAALCSWVTPTVAALISIGPVHLERFGSEERIVAAKSEILDRAQTGVICVDHPLLAALAEERSTSMDLIRVSTGDQGLVTVNEGRVRIGGAEVVEAPPGAFPANVAVAVGVCLALGVDQEVFLPRLADLPSPEHRQTVSASDRGFTIIDNTFNSNPDGARAGLRALVEASPQGRKAVVTPGMVELGPQQSVENRAFAAAAAEIAEYLLIVGRTNRRPLLEGADGGVAAVSVVADRTEAVEWVRANLGPGDAVLYENDLPDHYP